jgi:hypothetical protein
MSSLIASWAMAVPREIGPMDLPHAFLSSIITCVQGVRSTIPDSWGAKMTTNLARTLAAVIWLGLAWGLVDLAGATPTAQAQEKKDKKQKNPQEGKKGSVIGTLTAKTENTIELKADGEEKARKYVPQWRGGQPAQGGGPDKEIVKIIKGLKVGDRLEVEWLFEERLRCMKITVVKSANKDKK